MIVWLSCLHMYLSVNKDRHTYTHTHTHTHRVRYDETGADEQRSLLTGTEKCASVIDSEVDAQTGNGALRSIRIRCVPGVKGKWQLPQNLKDYITDTLHQRFPTMGVRDMTIVVDHKNEVLRTPHPIANGLLH